MWAVCDWLKISFSFDEPKPPGEDSDVVIILNSMCNTCNFLLLKKKIEKLCYMLIAFIMYNYVAGQLFL